MRRSSRPGFTIVEILVVVAIIGILVGLLLPALAGANKSSRKLNEVNNIRQFYTAWTQYATHNKDMAIPGYLDYEQVNGNSVQSLWRVDYEMPDGTVLDPRIAAPYTWRLLPYLEFDHDLVHNYKDENNASIMSMMDEAEEIGYEPAFGYNGLYIGGYWEMNNDGDRAFARFNQFRGDDRKFNQVARSTTQVNADQIVFASSSLFETPGQYKNFESDTAGHFLVGPPVVADEQVWGQGGSLGGGNDNAATGLDPTALNIFAEETSAPIGRYTGAAAIVVGDGSASSQTPGSLLDQRRWQHRADSKDYTHPDG